MSRVSGDGNEYLREWNAEIVDRMLAIILNEISIMNRKRGNFEGLVRIWLTITVTAIIAVFSLTEVDQIAGIAIALYGFMMTFETLIQVVRAERIGDALRGMLLRHEFGLPPAEDGEQRGITEYMSLVVAKGRQLPSVPTARDARNKNNDIGEIINQYSAGIRKRSRVRPKLNDILY